MSIPLCGQDIAKVNDIQNYNAQRFIEQYPDAIVGKINWYRPEDRGYKKLIDCIPLANFSCDFAIPCKDKNRTLTKLLIDYNDSTWTSAADISAKIEQMFERIDRLKGILFFWV